MAVSSGSITQSGQALPIVRYLLASTLILIPAIDERQQPVVVAIKGSYSAADIALHTLDMELFL